METVTDLAPSRHQQATARPPPPVTVGRRREVGVGRNNDSTQLAGEFALGEPLGAGGNATVFAATHLPTGTPVAVKVLHTEARTPANRAALGTEAAIATRITHPGVVRAFSPRAPGPPAAASAEPRDWLAFELVPGCTLSAHVRVHGPLPLADALTLGAAALEALSALHAVGVVHRDVSPANLMLDARIGAPLDPATVRLIDLGLCAPPGRPATARGASAPETSRHAAVVSRPVDPGVLGNPRYLSPEQAQGLPVGVPGDLYHLGGVLMFALTGEPPFTDEDPHAAMCAHVREAPLAPSARRPGLPSGVDALILRALAKDPADRFPSADAMLDEVRRLGGPLADRGSGTGTGTHTGITDSGVEAITDRLVVVPPLPGNAEWRATNARSARRVERAPRSRRTGWLLGTAGIGVFAAALGLAVIASLQSSIETGIDAERSRVAVQAVEPSPTTAPAIDAPIPRIDTEPGGAETVRVPDVVGMHRADAELALARAGLDLGPITRTDGPQAAETVLASSRPSRASVPPGTRIRLTVASGSNVVPEVVGLRARDARARLEAEGFVAALVILTPEAPGGPDDPGGAGENDGTGGGSGTDGGGADSGNGSGDGSGTGTTGNGTTGDGGPGGGGDAGTGGDPAPEWGAPVVTAVPGFGATARVGSTVTLSVHHSSTSSASIALHSFTRVTHSVHRGSLP